MRQPFEVAAPGVTAGQVVVGSRTEVARIAEVAHAVIPRRIVATDLGSAVFGCVIAKDQLEVTERLCERRADRVLEKGLAVVDGHPYADEGHLAGGLGILTHHSPLAIRRPAPGRV